MKEATKMNYRSEFVDAQPFPHAVIDDYFSEKEMQEAASVFPNHQTWRTDEWNRPQPNGTKHEKKNSNTSDVLNVAPEPIKKILKHVNSQEFLDFLSSITGIQNLIPDNKFQGGGMHQIEHGGYLDVHLDFTRHKTHKNLYRRANILLYMNPDWQDEWGGNLELWTNSRHRGGERVKEIRPVLGRMVIFGTAKNSWHGHPNPLNTPEGVRRNSLAAYYYSEESSDDKQIRGTTFS